MAGQINRREFFKKSVVAGAGLGLVTAGTGKLIANTTKSFDKVPRNKLGSTGETIPIILLGCAQTFDYKYDKILHRCYKEGVDYLDTALAYEGGNSHRSIAPFIKQIGDRKKLWITSKVPARSGSTTPKNYKQRVDTCLKQLETDYVDMLYMHGINDLEFVSKEWIKVGEELKKAGKIRHFGFSCHSSRVVELMNKAAELKDFAAIMFRYSFGKYGDKKLNMAIDNCKKAGIGLIAMKTQKSIPKSEEAVIKFKSKNFTLGQAKLKSVWADDRIDSAVSHMDNIQLVKENIEAAKSPIKLGMHEFQQLNRLAALTAPYSCEGCSDICESRIKGKVNVSDALRYLMYHDSYNDPIKAKQLYGNLSKEEVAVEGVDFRAAEKACPQGIKIAERLLEAKKLMGTIV